MTDERLLTVKQVAEATSLSVKSIRAYVKSGKFPAPYRIGEKRVAWKHSEVQQWIADKTTNPEG